MKIDLAGPERRGLAMRLNEFAGYLAVALAALATGLIAARYGLRPQPFFLGVLFVVVGLVLSIALVRETRAHAEHEARTERPEGALSQGEVFARTSFRDPDLSAVSQAGFVNNLNDGMSWGLFPLFFAAAGMSLRDISWLAAVCPAVWGVGQLLTGALSDRFGRKWLIASGLWVQAAGIATVAVSDSFPGFAGGAVLLAWGPRWSIRRCSPRSATSRTRAGARRRSACTGSGAISATRPAPCSPVPRLICSGSKRPSWPWPS
jgi:predicted MFS family arabinose efflux permease